MDITRENIFGKLTDAEIFDLERKDYEVIVETVMLRKGIPFLNKPIPPEKVEVPKGKEVYYTNLLGYKFATTTLETAIELRDSITRLFEDGGLFPLEINNTKDKSLYTRGSKLRAEGWRGDTDAIITEKVCAEEQVREYKDKLRGYFEKKEKYNKELEEYNKVIEEKNKLYKETNKIYHEIYNKEFEKRQLNKLFNEQYLRREPDLNKALDFFKLAKTPTQEQVQYLIENNS